MAARTILLIRLDYLVPELPAAPLEPVLEPLPMPLPMPVLPAPVVPLVPLELPELPLALRRSSRRHFSFSSPLIESHLLEVLLAPAALPPTVLPVPTLEPDGELLELLGELELLLDGELELPDALDGLLELLGELELLVPAALEGLLLDGELALLELLGELELLLPAALEGLLLVLPVLLPDMPLVPEALEPLAPCCSFRQVSLCVPVRPSQRELDEPDAPVPEPVVAAGELPVVPGLLVVVPELLVEPELCANAALATSATAAAVPSNLNIVELLPRGGGRRLRNSIRKGHAVRTSARRTTCKERASTGVSERPPAPLRLAISASCFSRSRSSRTSAASSEAPRQAKLPSR